MPVRASPSVPPQAEPSVPPRSAPRARLVKRILPTFTSAVIAAAYVIIAPRSEDLAAHLLRAKLFSVEGWFGIWNNWWYAGHNLPGYSVLFPPRGGADHATTRGRDRVPREHRCCSIRWSAGATARRPGSDRCGSAWRPVRACSRADSRSRSG